MATLLSWGSTSAGAAWRATFGVLRRHKQNTRRVSLLARLALSHDEGDEPTRCVRTTKIHVQSSRTCLHPRNETVEHVSCVLVIRVVLSTTRRVLSDVVLEPSADEQVSRTTSVWWRTAPCLDIHLPKQHPLVWPDHTPNTSFGDRQLDFPKSLPMV